MDEELKKRIVAALGKDAEALDDQQLLSAAVESLEEAFAFNAELSADKANLATDLSAATAEITTLKGQVTELSNKKPDGVIELSAGTRQVYTTNVELTVDKIASKNGWNTATVDKWKKTLAADGTVNLSANAAGDVTQTVNLSTLFDLAGALPVQALNTSETTETTKLSRTASDSPNPQPKSGNPLLDVAKSTK